MTGTILNVGVLGVGMHPGAWRAEEGATSANGLDFYAEIGRLAEKGKLHAIFLADTLAADEENFERPILGAMDPTLVLAALSAGTRHVGLVATASTSYNEPFNIARRFATLDHLSGGRGGWNVVTTFVPAVAANFSDAPLPEGTARYDRAEEFVDVVRALWGSWQPGALVADRAGGLYANRGRISAPDHRGAHFSVRGPLTLPRSPQGAPVLFQAGSSNRGRALAARTADAVFTVQNVLPAAQAIRRDVRDRTRGFGRNPDQVKVLPGLVPILGGTEAEARARKDRLDHLSGNAELKKLALRVGVPVGELALDEPLPLDLVEANAGFRGSEGFRAAAVKLAREERLTVRELLYRNGGGHLQVVGTPEQVADVVDLWTVDGAADGFNVMMDVLPAGLSHFVDEVVPLLQRRGTFRRDFTGSTLRANLDLEVPA
jgi:FMN-dependent oxidoreductase (nitrilotriacetate monooxygenase family)